jgi:hypothetical protein
VIEAEYINGRLLQGLLPLERVLQYAGHICDALIAALTLSSPQVLLLLQYSYAFRCILQRW